MIKIIRLLFFCLILSCFLSSPVYASDQFEVKHQLIYRFLADGTSNVTNQVTLLNLTSGTYPSSYDMSLSGDSLLNISGTDSQGPLKISVLENTSKQSTIHITFNHISAGLGKSMTFTLNYQTSPAVYQDHSWNIVLPQISQIDSTSGSTITLIVPPEFGQPLSILPPPDSKSGQTYIFSKTAITEGVKAVFGAFEVYNFSGSLSLTNSHPNSRILSLLIPSDSPNQRVFFTAIEPLPLNVTVNTARQWLADYQLQPGETKSISLRGFAYVFSSPSSLTEFPHLDWIPADYQQLSTLPLDYSWQLPFQFLPFKDNSARLVISNPNPVSVYLDRVWFSSYPSLKLKSTQYNPQLILPLGKINLPVVFQPLIIPPLSSQYLVFNHQSQAVTYNIPDYLFTFWHVLIILIITIGIILLAAITVRAWNIHIQKRRRANTLRR